MILTKSHCVNKTSLLHFTSSATFKPAIFLSHSLYTHSPVFQKRFTPRIKLKRLFRLSFQLPSAPEIHQSATPSTKGANSNHPGYSVYGIRSYPSGSIKLSIRNGYFRRLNMHVSRVKETGKLCGGEGSAAKMLVKRQTKR